MGETATERNARKNKEAVKKLAEYKAKGFHMLVPAEITIDDIMEGFALTVSEPVLLAPHPRDKDVYAHEKADYDWQKNDWRPGVNNGNQLVRFTKIGYYKLAAAANIEWTKPAITHDTTGKELKVYADIAALYRTHEGNYQQIPDGKGIDMEAVKLNKPKEYNRIRENIDQLCRTGAKLRCIRQIFVQSLPEVVPVSYLKQPFIAVKILPFLDYSDPYTKKLLTQMQVASMAGIYGMGASVAQPEQIAYKSGKIDPTKCGDDTDVVEGEVVPNDATYSLNGHDAPPAPEEPPPDLRQDFLNSDCAAQCVCLTSMAKEAGLTPWLANYLAKSKKTIEQLSVKTKTELYDYFAKQLEKKGAKAA